MTAITASAFGQSYSKDYVAFPESASFPGYVTQWKNGTLKMEDENFFISRVKPKTRFRNIATQVNQSLTANNDKRLVYWVPVGDNNSDGGCNALPNGVFDSEVFSMWSYVDHYGDWTAPHGWVPGNFADVAHKNGVGVSGVASIPFGSINSSWNSSLTQQAALSSTDVAKFLYYHGVDGLGYNSEFSGNSTAVTAIAKQHGDIIKYLEEHGNPAAEHIWYDGTGTDGSIHFDQGLGSHNQNLYGVNGERRSSLFFNYNWNRNSNLGRSVTKANELKVDPRYIYAGFNMQGNDPGSNNWVYLSQNNVSIGLWGAHANNMFWAGRNAGGSNPQAMQRTYLNTIERFFGNGPQNPAIELPVVNGPCNQGVPTFFGMSAMKTAKSSLGWDLTEEPFITYFNLGNGQFFNWEGKRANNCEWYNIGVQDYLPTWRYWWAPSLLGRGVEQGDVKLNASFSWSDAFMGGSCLQITGTQSEAAYLHLFKTQFAVQRGDVITFSYKLNRGTATKVSLVFSAEGTETTAIEDASFVLIDNTTEADDEAWVTKEITLNRGA
ncbi:MAG: secretion protein, partial [Muribaculaceae bacterium]|nr:secretion protein [Muribaculaceae bacterium]